MGWNIKNDCAGWIYIGAAYKNREGSPTSLFRRCRTPNVTTMNIRNGNSNSAAAPVRPLDPMECEEWSATSTLSSLFLVLSSFSFFLFFLSLTSPSFFLHSMCAFIILSFFHLSLLGFLLPFFLPFLFSCFLSFFVPCFIPLPCLFNSFLSLSLLSFLFFLSFCPSLSWAHVYVMEYDTSVKWMLTDSTLNVQIPEVDLTWLSSPPLCLERHRCLLPWEQNGRSVGLNQTSIWPTDSVENVRRLPRRQLCFNTRNMNFKTHTTSSDRMTELWTGMVIEKSRCGLFQSTVTLFKLSSPIMYTKPIQIPKLKWKYFK